MKHVFPYFIFLLTSACGTAQKLDTKAIDSLFTIYDQKELFFVNVLVKRADSVLFQRSAGFQNLESGVKNHSKTQFLIGSITKTYTAVLILQLVEEGKIRLDDPLSKFYPQLSNADRITISMMLRHRSGLFNYTNMPGFLQQVDKSITKEQFLETFKTLKTEFEPDTKYEYSNTNYLLLGLILETITGDTYENLLKNRILTKIGARNTFYGRPQDRKDFAKSYIFTGEKWLSTQPEWNIDWAAAAGGIATTSSDLALFYEGLFNGKLISEKSLTAMIDLKDGYGYGISSVPFGRRTFYGHGGGIESYVSFVGYNREDKTLFIQLVNGRKQFEPNDISIQILNAAYGYPLSYPDLSVRKVVKVEKEVLTSYEGTYTSANFPLEITVFVKDGNLFGQATGQSAFQLTPYSDTEFGFEAARIKMIFFEKVGQKAFHFSQGNAAFDFVRKP
ncbi:serine hydrolase domain-containing protein [Arundinibacter roseus]|uniref:Serine hydrolase n=1 Tax=Arundinibacter roseus TaxID=2070510 RepID=A0A4R4KHC9_9BACT|nr:serine hydrolase domain-containing protein [Arundinibacter roseus]TDB67487.1 serine hydrolase [Arundinibacter roseus]